MSTVTKTFILRAIGENRGLNEVSKAAKQTEIRMGQLALRAAAVIPIWALLRSTMLALPRVIFNTTREFLDFSKEMSRVATVSRTSAEGMQILEKNIREVTIGLNVSFKDTASAVYALGSAGLTAQQQITGLNHVVNVAVATGANLERTTKLIAGAFNVFGASLKGAVTDAEKFQRIADTLAYTYSCYTPDTEVLTDKGWKLFTELDKTEKMATLDPVTHELIYQKPYEYVNQPFEGELHHIKGKFVDIMVTPNHKLYAKMGQHKDKPYQLIEAQEAHGKYKSFYRGSKWEGKDPEFFILPAVENKTGHNKETKIHIKTWVKFLAWYLAEGYSQYNNNSPTHPIYRVNLCQSTKSKYLNDLETTEPSPCSSTSGETTKYLISF